MWVSIADLTPWARNPRKNDKAVARVADSIMAFGFGAPLLARKANGEIIAGHTRIRAAERAGLDRVPVRYLDLTEEQAHALALADNKLGEIANWDDALLATVLSELKADGVNLNVSGFAEHELRKILEADGGSTFDSGEAVETAPERLQTKWKTALGQTWRLPSATTKDGEHRIRCGSSIDESHVAALMAGARADMMWTDPPYGVAYVGKTADALEIENDAQSPAELRAFLTEAFRVAPLKAGAAWYISYPDKRIREFLGAIDDAKWIYRQGLVWLKDSMVLGKGDYHYKHEPILFGYTNGGKGRLGRGGDRWSGGDAEVSVFDVPRPKVSEFHPTMKPIELVARMVCNSSKPRAVVYEPFSGSGSTMLACEAHGRLCRAVELDPKYVAVALERMAEVGCLGELVEA